MSETALEQVPIPCRTCGAPMREKESAMVIGPIVVECSFCHATEELPRDLAERVRGLKSRLAKIRWAEQVEEGPAIAIAQTIESWRKHTLPMVGAMVVFLLLMFAQSVFHQSALPYASAARTIASVVFGLLQYALILGAVLGGTWWALRLYKRDVQPSIEARAPLAEGAPLRCRSCGGDLPRDGLHGFVRCAYCTAENLVTDAIAQERQRKLDAELKVRQARAAGMQLRVRESAERYKNRLYFFVGVAVVGSLVFQQIYQAIYVRLFL